MKIEQVAIGTNNAEKLVANLSALFGHKSWHNDKVVAEGEVFGVEGTNQASLNFNYDIGPFEFEILEYLEGNNWHKEVAENQGMNFLSHLGVHVDDPDEFNDVYDHLKSQGIIVAQEVYTQSHTNPAIKDERRYHYVIFDTRDSIGFDFKMIQRLDLHGNPYVMSDEDKLRRINGEKDAISRRLEQLRIDEEAINGSK